MTAFENIVIAKDSIPSLIITVIFFITIPVVFFVCWRMKHKQQTSLRWLIAGAVGFIVSARMLELGVHYFCILSDNPVSGFIQGNTAAFVLYGTAMAGFFEECGRHVTIKYMMKKNRTPENAVMYGIGHGGIEIIAVLLPAMITCLAAAVLFSSGNTEKALSSLKITEENAAAALPAVQAAAAFDYGTMAANVIERLLSMFIHIGLTVIVFYGVICETKSCLPAAILLHMLTDTFPALYQRGVVPLWAVEVWAALWTAVVVYAAFRLYRKMKEQTVS